MYPVSEAFLAAVKNPRLSQAKTKNDKNISGFLNQIEAGKIRLQAGHRLARFVVR